MLRRTPQRSRRSRQRSRQRLAAVSVAGTVLLAGCSLPGFGDGGGDGDGGGGSGKGKGGGGGTLPATGMSQWVLAKQPVRVDLLSLDKTSGKAVTARLRVTHFGAEGSFLFSQSDLGGRKSANDTLSGVTLVDGVNRKRYYPWWGADDRCVCSIAEGTGMFIEPGTSAEYFVNFPVPPVREVMLFVPNTPPFMDVPIGDRPGPVTAPEGQEERDPAKVALDGPEIVSVTDESQALDGSSEQTVNDQKVEVRLSADVLFAINKADLNPRAQDVLRRVAAQINASKSATVVTIDGYTDDTGNDAINVPLSQRRAQAVQKALAPMVTKPGITYRASGHGSADPVAGNDTEENRKRNRRVTIGFAR
ncbi:OmpA family protein [Actinomadura sp. KC216]|uniref:OmpA family protein n=1 Tax=Actinomadura sp. KC216 TaxID=2530370 RepID=UPI00104FFB19|nr:OmpA family protein [Actinomadura sp. KC216]TDB83606.1 OmpA family protein [Actinomadura sp. KC216]